MKIAIGADSAGKPLLDVIAAHLATKSNVTVTDLHAELREWRERGWEGK